jgi:hypothetical protein
MRRKDEEEEAPRLTLRRLVGRLIGWPLLVVAAIIVTLAEVLLGHKRIIR